MLEDLARLHNFLYICIMNEDYKLRRKLAKSAIKEYLRGRIVWRSFSFGTFVKNKNIEAEV